MKLHSDMKIKINKREARKMAAEYRDGPKSHELQKAVLSASEAAMKVMSIMDPGCASHDHIGKVVDDYNILIDESLIEMFQKDKKEVIRCDSGPDYFGGQGHLVVRVIRDAGFLCVFLWLNITNGIPLIKK
jgi:hypothetical protein